MRFFFTDEQRQAFYKRKAHEAYLRRKERKHKEEANKEK